MHNLTRCQKWCKFYERRAKKKNMEIILHLINIRWCARCLQVGRETNIQLTLFVWSYYCRSNLLTHVTTGIVAHCCRDSPIQLFRKSWYQHLRMLSVNVMLQASIKLSRNCMPFTLTDRACTSPSRGNCTNKCLEQPWGHQCVLPSQTWSWRMWRAGLLKHLTSSSPSGNDSWMTLARWFWEIGCTTT